MWRVRALRRFLSNPLRLLPFVITLACAGAAMAFEQVEIPLLAISVISLLLFATMIGASDVLSVPADSASHAEQLRLHAQRLDKYDKLILGADIGAGVTVDARTAAQTVLKHAAVSLDKQLNHEQEDLVRARNELAGSGPLAPTTVAEAERQVTAARHALGAAIDRANASAGAAGAVEIHSPQITVVVPNFNDEQYLEDCLRSVAQQTFTDFECIVIDDGSTDGSVQIADRFAEQDERFHLIRHEENSGLSAARNTGLRLAKAPLVAFLDSDDLFLAENLSERFDEFSRNQDASVAGVFSGVEQCPAHTLLDGLEGRRDWRRPGFKDLLTTEGDCPFNCHAPLLRTALLRAVGGFDETMRSGAEDWDLWLRLMRQGYEFRPTKNVLALYRQKPQSMIRAMPAEHLAAASRLLESVHCSAAPDLIAADAPFVFAKPLSHYKHQMTLAKRAFQYMGLASVTGDTAQLQQTIESIDPAMMPIFHRHFKVENYIHEGVRRGLGLTEENYKKLHPQATWLVDRTLALVAGPTVTSS